MWSILYFAVTVGAIGQLQEDFDEMLQNMLIEELTAEERVNSEPLTNIDHRGGALEVNLRERHPRASKNHGDSLQDVSVYPTHRPRDTQLAYLKLRAASEVQDTVVEHTPDQDVSDGE